MSRSRMQYGRSLSCLLAVAAAAILAGRADAQTVIYDSTNYTTSGAVGYGTSANSTTDLAAIYGDRVYPTGTGVLESLSFALFNSASSTGNLTSATETISFYKGSDNSLLGSYTFSVGPLSRGNSIVISKPNLTSLDIQIPYDASGILVRQQLSNVVGSTRMGTSFGTNSVHTAPAVGTTAAGFFFSATGSPASESYTLTSYPANSNGVYKLSVLPTIDWNTTTGTWSTSNSVVNWKYRGMPGGSTVAFSNNALATFANTDGGTVILSGSLAPKKVTVSAASGTYAFSSSAGNQLTGVMTLDKSGAGTMVLSGPNTYSGATTLAAGTLRVGDGAAVGTGQLVLNGGTFASDGATARSLSNTIGIGGDVTLGDGTGTGALTLSGTVDLNSGTRTITTNADVLVSGRILSGGLTKAGAGKLTLSGSSTYSGPTSVQVGVLALSGTLANSAVTVASGAVLAGNGFIGSNLTVSGTLSPGNSPGRIATSGTLTLGAGSTTLMEIVGVASGTSALAGTAGTDYDTVVVSSSGGLTYGGSLLLNFLNATPFANGTFFDLFQFSGSRSGDFTSVGSAAGSSVYSGLSFTDDGDTWTSVVGSQKLTFATQTGRLLFEHVPEIDPASLSSVLGLVTGCFGLLEPRLRRRTRTDSHPVPSAA